MSKAARGLKTEEDGIVYFEIDGKKVSNDPNFDEGEGTRAQAQARQIEEAQANLQQQQLETAKANREASENASRSAEVQDYSTQKPAELKELATNRGLDLTGIKKKSQLVELLQKADAAQRPTEFTGQDIQGDVSPLDQQAEAARRAAEEGQVVGGTDVDPENIRGLSNDSHQEPNDDDDEDDDDEEDDEE